jgi:hypothetical protein
MATWTLRNRRSFAVLERLGELSGTGIVLAGSLGDLDAMPANLSDAQRAMSVAEAGEHALTLIIETAASTGGRGGKARKVWKALTPERGASAAVFLAHGLAATTARLASAPGHHLSVARQEDARALLRRHFPWSNGDEAEVGDAADGIHPASAMGIEDARIQTAFGAVRRIIGEDAARLPGFAAWSNSDPADQYLAGLGWQICFNHSLRPFLAVTDPDGLAKAEVK